MDTNLLSVNDVIKLEGPVLFTKEGAFLIPSTLYRILNVGKKIAIRKNGIFLTRGTISPRKKHRNVQYTVKNELTVYNDIQQKNQQSRSQAKQNGIHSPQIATRNTRHRLHRTYKNTFNEV